MIARERLPAAAARPRIAPLPARLHRSHAVPADAGHSCACGGTCPRCSGRTHDDDATMRGREYAADSGGGGGAGGGTGSGSGGGVSGGGCASTKTLKLDFVKLRQTNRNPATDLTFANRVFAPACVQFTSTGVNTATRAQSDGWLGGDRDLATGVCPATTEETNTYNGAVTAFSLSSRLKAFYVRSLSTGDRGNSHPPYCAGTGVAASTINVANSGRRRTLAHEIGHILLNSGDHPAATDNLMHPTNTSTGENLTAAQRSTIFANA